MVENQNTIEMKKNHKKSGGLGGYREGSGRKPGVSKATKIKRAFQDYFEEREIAAMIRLAKKESKTKPEILKFVLEQLFGKAPQKINMDVKGGITLKIVEQELRKICDEELEENSEGSPDTLQERNGQSTDIDRGSTDDIQRDLQEIAQ